NNGLNDATLTDDPSPVVTVNGPFTASTGTCTTTDVAVCDTKNAPALPVKSTVGTPLNPVPEIVTFAPATADAGVNPVTCGRTTKFVELAPIPPAVVTVIAPVVAAAGTTTCSEVPSAATVLKAPATPLNLTEASQKNPVP